jgi:tetratricopeptide (TPR) repeat protein
MVRGALSRDPDSAAMQDTLGWVLYKQKRFKESWDALRPVLEPSRSDWVQWAVADWVDHPVILDHAGDVLYRLGDTARALERWRQAEEACKQDEHPGWDVRDVLKNAPAKIKAVEAGKPAPVAPVVE